MSQSIVAELAPRGVLRAAINMSNFLLVTRGFHWVQEYPFNR